MGNKNTVQTFTLQGKMDVSDIISKTKQMQSTLKSSLSYSAFQETEKDYEKLSKAVLAYQEVMNGTFKDQNDIKNAKKAMDNMVKAYQNYVVSAKNVMSKSSNIRLDNSLFEALDQQQTELINKRIALSQEREKWEREFKKIIEVGEESGLSTKQSKFLKGLIDEDDVDYVNSELDTLVNSYESRMKEIDTTTKQIKSKINILEDQKNAAQEAFTTQTNALYGEADKDGNKSGGLLAQQEDQKKAVKQTEGELKDLERELKNLKQINTPQDLANKFLKLVENVQKAKNELARRESINEETGRTVGTSKSIGDQKSIVNKFEKELSKAAANYNINLEDLLKTNRTEEDYYGFFNRNYTQVETNAEKELRDAIASKTTEYKNQQEALEKTNKQVSEAKKQEEEYSNSLSETTKEIDAQEKKISDLNAERNQLSKQVTTTEAVRTQVGQKQNFSEQEGILDQEQSEINTQRENITAEAQEKVMKALANDENAVARAIETANEKGEEQNNTFSSMIQKNEQLKQTFERLKDSISQFFGVQNAFYQIRQAVQQTFQDIQNLDKAFASIAMVTDYSVDEMWSSYDQYSEMARELGQSTQDVIEASALFYQQGLDTAESLELTESTMKLATLAGSDFETATSQMTAALRGFNMEMDEGERVTDVYSELAAKAAADVISLAS